MTTFNIEIDSLPLPNGLVLDGSGNLKVVNESTVLPTGAATEATLAAAKTDLDTLASTVTASKVAVSAASLPLPTGAATETSLGTDGATPPSIPGTGIRGWLRSIYDKLASSIAVTWTDPSEGTTGSAVPGTASLGGGSDGTNLQALATDNNGRLKVLGNTQTPIIIQKASAVVASGTSIALAFANAVKSGNTIVVCFGIGSASGVANIVSDTLKNVFQSAADETNTGMQTGIRYAPVLASGANTVTLAWTGSLAGAIEIYEVQGLGTLDAAAVGTSANTAVSLTLAINAENEMGFMAVGAGAATIAAASPAFPASIQSDSGNLATSGSGLVNFAAFSALFGGGISNNSNNTLTAQQAQNTMKATLSGSVVSCFCAAVFRPVALQITGVVSPTSVIITAADGFNNAFATPSGSNPGGGGLGSGSSLIATVYGFLFNGTSWDRRRGSVNATTGDTGTKIATFNGATQTNFNALSAYITILLGTVSGTLPTLAAQLQWSPDGGTTWVNLGAVLGNLTTTSQIGTFIVSPALLTGLTTGSTQTGLIAAPMPRTWRIVFTIAGTNPSFAISSVNVNYCN